METNKETLAQAADAVKESQEVVFTPPTVPYPDIGSVYVKIKEPEKKEDDTFNFFGVSDEMLHGKGAEVPEVPYLEKVKQLLERGKRMSDADLDQGGKMKVDVKTRADIKHFLDELFRAGNLYLYTLLCTALETNEKESIFTFVLSIDGNWQEYRGPIEAKIKMKAYWSNDPVRTHKVFSIGGSMELGYYWPAPK